MVHKIARIVFLLLIFLFFPFSGHNASALDIGVSFAPISDENVKGYKLYYGLSKNLDKVVDLGNETEYYFCDQQPGTKYYLAGSAYDKDGNESELSELIIFEVPSGSQDDSDGDGTPDSEDMCPNDPNKIDPGACGCGIPDNDSDNDGFPDCDDLCPFDPNKTVPGKCGCGIPETDCENDGISETIIDNTDSGFTTTGSWPASSSSCGYYGTDYLYNSLGSGSDQAKWSFAVIEGEYQISAQWTAHSNRASNAGYRVYNNGKEIGLQIFDQRINGGRFNVFDTTYILEKGTLDVVLTDNADGYIIADAVRVVHLGPNSNQIPIILDPLESNIIEIGETLINHNWTKVTFKQPFVDPVVIAKPASYRDSDPAVIRIRNITNNDFEIKIQEWAYLDGIHNYENVSYIVMEKGTYILPGDIMVEAGIFKADANQFQFKSFEGSFLQTPVVIASTISENEFDAVTGRISNVDIDGFDFCLQEQETTKNQHMVETISYIAWEPSSGSLNNLSFEVETTGDVIGHEFKYLPYIVSYSAVPALLADMQTTNGIDTANIRWQNRDKYGVEIKVSEEASKDSEINHTCENIGYILLCLYNDNFDSEIIIDNTDSYFTTEGSWKASSHSPGYYGTDYLYHGPGNGFNETKWSFAVMEGEYKISAQWTAHSNRASNAGYRIYNNGIEIGMQVFDQRINGGRFNVFDSTYILEQGTLDVVLNDDADGYVIADAVRVVYLGSESN